MKIPWEKVMSSYDGDFREVSSAPQPQKRYTKLSYGHSSAGYQINVSTFNDVLAGYYYIITVAWCHLYDFFLSRSCAGRSMRQTQHP